MEQSALRIPTPRRSLADLITSIQSIPGFENGRLLKAAIHEQYWVISLRYSDSWAGLQILIAAIIKESTPFGPVLGSASKLPGDQVKLRFAVRIGGEVKL